MTGRTQSSSGSIQLIVFLAICIVVGSAFGLLMASIKNAPALDDITFDPKMATVVYDANEKVITRFYVENRTPVPLSKVAPIMHQAIVAIEDNRFYDHRGVDAKAILRAIVEDLRQMDLAQGGSTITQQLARNAFLSHEKTFARKLSEAIYAVQIERKYTKDEILEKYLNQIYFGHGAYGIEAASQLYFNKSASDLNLTEAAMLAGLPRSPYYYSPHVDKEAALRRRNTVLARMAELGYITQEEKEKAQKEPIEVVPLKGESKAAKAPYFSDHVLKYLLEHYDQSLVFGGGLKVYTTLDLSWQEAAEKALLKNLPNGPVDGNGLQQPQGALIALDPRTGAIRAMVGGRGTDKFNRATQAKRQPGSAFKPIIYAAAIADGYTPSSMFEDKPLTYTTAEGTWKPSNYDGRYRGPITLREALEQSVNTVAVQVLEQVGVDKTIDFAKRMGITSLVEKGWPSDRNLSLALGGLTRGVTPLELASAFAVFANGGIRTWPMFITRIEDRHGNVLESNTPREQQVISKEVSAIMNSLLTGVVTRRTGRSADIGRPSAGKTGTTNDHTNVWYVGYTPELVAAVWIGNDSQSKPLIFRGSVVRSSLPARIWAQFAKAALAGTAPTKFAQPASLLEKATICVESGKLATANCPQTREETFFQGQAPTEPCWLHSSDFFHQEGLGEEFPEEQLPQEEHRSEGRPIFTDQFPPQVGEEKKESHPEQRQDKTVPKPEAIPKDSRTKPSI